ncbi:MAG: response regulator [Proteobacteria bacterium]|nr:response regulator [Pseudomonadota bacterium]
MSTPASAPIVLIASDVPTDANLVAKMLREEFEKVAISTDVDQAAQDFERHQPDVLILAFNGLEKAERYYLGLYRQCQSIHHRPHRTLILCNKDDIRRVYELCRKEYFDDYMLFWPLTFDTPRLPMAVHQALKALTAVQEDALKRQLASQARRIAELEEMLRLSLAQGDNRIHQADQKLKQAGLEINAALDRFSHRLIDGQLAGAVEVRNVGRLQDELGRLKENEIRKQLVDAEKAVAPMRGWVTQLRQEVTPYIEAAHSMQSAADRILPRIMVVDDDAFQRKLAGQALGNTLYELVFADSGAAALGMLRKIQPDIILMDFELPDIDGIEVTRRIRATPQMAGLPIVMLTGHRTREVVIGSVQAGANDFVIKPINAGDLRAKINRHLGKG